jgi:hypothetical protein
MNGSGWLSRYRDSLHAGKSGDQIPLEGGIFHMHPDRPWGPTILLYKVYWVSPWGKVGGGVATRPHLALWLK